MAVIKFNFLSETLMQQARHEALKQGCRIRTGQLMKEVG